MRSFLRAHWVLAALVLLLVGGGVGIGVWSCSREPEAEGFELRVPVSSEPVAFALALHQSLGVQLRPGHEVTLLSNGRVFDALEADIRNAKSSVDIVLYIWEKGAASDRIVAALVERARAGVACRIVVDDLGSPDFGKDLRPALSAAGCDVRIFRPVAKNDDELARNHRKIAIIDGVTAITGGFGIRDNWLGDGVSNESWRDANARFTGPAVAEAQQVFAENWQEAGGPLLPAAAFPPIADAGAAAAAFVGSTASPTLTRAERLEQLMIQAAHKRLWIANAYFVPSRAILDMLQRKASEGVDVRILVPGKKSDSKTSFGIQLAEYGPLIEHGVAVWEYQPSMMHAKTMLVDDDLVTVASINLDPLSLGKLEESALVVQDAAFAATLAASFDADCTHAERLTE